MQKDKKTTLAFEVQCPLKGTSVCPKPKECNGINRLCEVHKKHSGK